MKEEKNRTKDLYQKNEKLQWQGGTLLGPVPAVLVTCADGETKNVFTVAWTGTLNTKPPKTYISVRPERYSHGILCKTREFVINMPTSRMVRSVDFCGVRSGKDTDKFAVCRLETDAANTVQCPVLRDAPISLECHVTDIVHLGSHDMFIADITAVDVDASLVDEKGKLHPERASLMAYLHGSYYTLGKKIGSFGYSVKRPHTKRK